MEAFQNLFIDIVGNIAGDTAGQDQGIAVGKGVDLGQEGIQFIFRDIRAHAVDSRFIVSADLEVNTRAAFIEEDKIRISAVGFCQPFDFLTRKAGHKAQHLRRDMKIAENEGHVNALAAGINHFLLCPIDIAGCKLLHVDDII